MDFFFSEQSRLEATRKLLEQIGALTDLPFSIRLWDGSLIPLGRGAEGEFFISLNGPGVIGSLLRKPSYENLLLHYAQGHIDMHGDLLDFIALVRARKHDKNAGEKINRATVLKNALPLLFTPSGKGTVRHQYRDEATGRQESRRNNQEFIQFHYDIGNDFYALFLDREMQYSCGYFTQADHSLEQARQDKLEMICRKLRLQPGEKLLDIGSGWGGLICYAARHYEVKAHGVTLSQQQFDFTKEKIRRLGLEERVSVELRDFATIEGSYDKISSIGMFEHIGIANMPRYFSKIN